MNIFYDNTVFYLQRHGGVSRYFSELIKRIANYNDTNVTALARLNILPRRLLRINAMFIDFKLAARKYDIYHPTYYCDGITKKKSSKIVVTVYDMIHELFSSRFNELGINIGVKKNSILNADHIICISNITKRDLKKIYNITDDRISVVHLGASLNGNSSTNAEFNRPQRPYILYVGKRPSYKNFNILLKVFHLLGLSKDFDLVCFGGGKFLPNEVSEFRRLKLENSIRYIEGPDELLQFYYKNAHMFILPSLYEGFGLSVLEAMVNGCPVIASNGGSIPEIAGDAALLFSPEAADELSSCVKLMLNDSQQRNEYIKKGRERAKNFSWDKTAQETYNVYKKVLNK